MERTRDVLLTRPNQVDQKYKINKILIIKKVDDRLVFITGSFIKNETPEDYIPLLNCVTYQENLMDHTIKDIPTH